MLRITNSTTPSLAAYWLAELSQRLDQTRIAAGPVSEPVAGSDLRRRLILSPQPTVPRSLLRQRRVGSCNLLRTSAVPAVRQCATGDFRKFPSSSRARTQFARFLETGQDRRSTQSTASTLGSRGSPYGLDPVADLAAAGIVAGKGHDVAATVFRSRALSSAAPIWVL